MSPRVRIGVLSDTHIPEKADRLPQKVLDGLKGVDMVIHAGDLVDLSVVEQLRSVCKDVHAVRGNMDYPGARGALPQKDIITVGRYKIGVVHGEGHPARIIDFVTEALKGEKVDIIVFGHSHCALNEKRGSILYFNPGSPTDDVFAPYKSYGMIEIGDTVSAKIIKL